MPAYARRCAVCGSGGLAPWFRTEFGVMGRCTACGQVLRADPLAAEELVALHRAIDVASNPHAQHSERASGELEFQDGFLDLCARRRPRGSILEVGCGTGEFV